MGLGSTRDLDVVCGRREDGALGPLRVLGVLGGGSGGKSGGVVIAFGEARRWAAWASRSVMARCLAPATSFGVYVALGVGRGQSFGIFKWDEGYGMGFTVL